MLARILLLFFFTVLNSTAVSSGKEASTTTATTVSAENTDNKICPYLTVLNDTTRFKATRKHNCRRSHLARGHTKSKNGKTLPQASNMLQLQYNCSLEFSAFISATRCSTKPLMPSGSGIQENIHLVPKSKAKNPLDAIFEALHHWWVQVRSDGGVDQSVKYTGYKKGNPITRFTRMAWATTKYVGCAVHSCKNSRWSVVCHYSPGGNKRNEFIYKKGSPCSACPSGYYCKAGKLCAPNKTAT
uniref:SCP domain-containing protein n=1 Tax=Haemonchus contortus TaxID=6289 RepID=A0A7I5EA68_HAECO